MNGTSGTSTTTGASNAEPVRTGLSADTLAKALLDNLSYMQARLPKHATRNDWYLALAYTVRERLLDHYVRTMTAIADATTPIRTVAYLSAEFLTGPHLGNALVNLGIWPAAEHAVAS